MISNKIGYMINESTTYVSEFNIVSENNDRVTGFGRLQTGNETNRNRRRYRTADLSREIASPRIVELITTGNLLAEAGHPLVSGGNSLVRQQTIDPTNSCCRFLKLWMEGDDVMGHFQGTNNALGETFDKDLRMGVKPAFSLRALGTIVASAEGAVVDNLKMITYDYVIYPSHPGAYTQGILNESASGILLPQSNFKLTDNMDATKSNIVSFTNEDVVNIMKSQAQNEAAMSFIKDKSYNFYLLKECYDMTSYDTIDIVGGNKLVLTEAGKNTIVMNIEDYIAKEIQNYKG